jgi:class 3 adenylate cyclase
MALKDDLISVCNEIFRSAWTHIDGQVVPETKSIPLNNTGKTIHAVVLYADLDQSTTLVDRFSAEFCAEVYKTFLRCASKIIASNGGAIRSFDGDRVMGVFLGQDKYNGSVKAAMQIKWAVSNALNPAARAIYKDAVPTVRHTVGVDVSDLLAVRAGMRDSNDLVWVGKAANYAAKLNALSADYSTRITADVYSQLSDFTKFGGDPRRSMWEADPDARIGRGVYRSNWHWIP